MLFHLSNFAAQGLTFAVKKTLFLRKARDGSSLIVSLAARRARKEFFLERVSNRQDGRRNVLDRARSPGSHAGR